MDQATRALAAEKDGADDARLAQAISEFVRAEFKAPVDVVLSFIDLLLEDVERGGYASYRGDLKKMQSAAQSTVHLPVM